MKCSRNSINAYFMYLLCQAAAATISPLLTSLSQDNHRLDFYVLQTRLMNELFECNSIKLSVVYVKDSDVECSVTFKYIGNPL